MGPLALLAASHVVTPTVRDGDARSDDRTATVAPPREGEKRRISVLHTIYAEGLGPLGLYSLNYDLAIGDVAVRVGGSYLPEGTLWLTRKTFTAGATISFIGVGTETERLEVGYSFAYAPGLLEECDSIDYMTVCTKTDLFLTGPHVGYRSHPTDGGFFTHIGVTTFIGVRDAPIIPWPYLGFGVSL